MLVKAIIIFSVVAAAAALTPGYLDGALAFGAQSEHTVRGFNGLSSVSKQHKAVDSPYSSVRKSDVRVTNDGVFGYAGYAPLAHAHHGYAAAPLAHAHHGYAVAPLGHAHGYAAAPLGHAHGYAAAPLGHAHGYAAAPLGHAHHAYAAAPLGHAHHGYAAAPHAHLGYAAPVAKLAYSPAGVGVSSHTFSGYGIHYGY